MRLLAFVSGRVQRAGYHARIVSLAKALDLTGTVQNLENGKVMVLAEGDEADLRRLQKGLPVKNHIIDVTSVEASYSQARGDFEDFFKLVGSGETDERLDTGIECLKKLIVVNEKGFQTLGEKVDCVGEKVAEVGRNVQCVGDGVKSLKAKMDRMQECQETTLYELKGHRSDIKEHLDSRFYCLEDLLTPSRIEEA